MQYFLTGKAEGCFAIGEGKLCTTVAISGRFLEDEANIFGFFYGLLRVALLQRAYDYPVRQQYSAWFHCCFILPVDYLANYARTESLGAIAFSKEGGARKNYPVRGRPGGHSNIGSS